MTGYSEPLLMVLLSTLVFLLPTFICGPSPQYSGQLGDTPIDQGMLDDIFGSSLDTARYGNTEEEWVEVPISLLPGEGEEDECGSMKQPRQEPQMMQMYEELNKIDVIKADGSKKCDFYRETEGYECVPYYQCDEGTIITDGGGLIDIRFGGESDQPELAILDFSDLMCSGSLDVCCKDPDFTKETNEELNEEREIECTGGYGGGCNEELVEEIVEETDPYSEPLQKDASSEESEEDNPYAENQEARDDSSEEETSYGGNEEGRNEEQVEVVDAGYNNEEDEVVEVIDLTKPSTGLIDYVPPQPEPEKLLYQPQCGRRNQEGLGVRINNNKDGEAQFGEWPHMCAIVSREIIEIEGAYGSVTEEEILTFVGGASLIAPGVAMTGAIKVDKFVDKATGAMKSDARLVVRCGEWDTQTESEPLKHQDRNVTVIIMHPEFVAKNVYNNIALVLFDAPFELANHVDTICLPKYQENFDDRRKCFVKGWGVDKFGEEGVYQVVMKEVDVPMVPHGECQTNLRNTPRLPRQFRLHKSFLCAGGEEGKDACRGDGGGPLVCTQEADADEEDPETLYTQVGIVAWGIGCGQKDVPGVYTDVAAQVCWIDWALSCQNQQQELFNGAECNKWMADKLKIRVRKLRDIYAACPLEWPSQNEELTEGGYGK